MWFIKKTKVYIASQLKYIKEKEINVYAYNKKKYGQNGYFLFPDVYSIMICQIKKKPKKQKHIFDAIFTSKRFPIRTAPQERLILYSSTKR